MRTAAGLLSVMLLAVVVEATASRNVEPDVLQGVMVGVGIVALLAAGFAFRWRGLAVFGVGYISTAAAHEYWFYDAPAECDPTCGSPAEGVVFLLPLLLVVVALGAVARSVRDRQPRRLP